MSKSQEIEAKIAARRADLATLKADAARGFASDAAKREHRLAEFDAAHDIEDYLEALAAAQANERSAFETERRASGRAAIAKVERVGKALETRYAKLSALLDDALAIALELQPLHTERNAGASFVVQLDPRYPDSLQRTEELMDVMRAAQGADEAVACSLAGTILRILDAVPAGQVVKERYLVPERFSSFGQRPLAVVAKEMIDSLNRSIRGKCEEPSHVKEAA